MRRELLAVALLALSAPASAAPDGVLVVEAGRGFDGRRFVEAPVSLACVDGRLAPSSDAKGGMLLKAPGLFVMPGLVDLRSGAGLPSWAANEEREESTAAWRALDALDPHAASMQLALRAGVTTIGVSPGGRNVIGGLAAAVKTDERALDERVVASEAALVVTLGSEPALGNRTARFQQPWGLRFRRPGNRMGVVAELRSEVFAAREGGHGAEAATLRRVLSGDLPAWFVARTDGDVRSALQLASELGTRPVIVEGHEAHRRIDEIAAAGGSVVIGPEYQLPRFLMERFEGNDARAATPALLSAQGVPVALATGLDDDPAALRDRASLAARHGMPRDLALAAITSVPARLLGLSQRLGSLAPGADADLVLLDGDPLSPATRVVAVIVDGRLRWSAPSCPQPEPRP